MPRKIDLTGQKFGRLTVQYEAEPKYTSGGNKKVVWHCLCECGNEKDICSANLLTGRTNSCGCLNLDKISERMKKSMKKYNTYDLETYEYGVGYTSKNEEFWFDKEDYDKIKDYCWHIHHKYVTARKLDGSGKDIVMHRLIMDYYGELDVDHIKTENKFDNRKCNLRIVERSHNNTNKVIQKNNKSGVPGVYYHNRKNSKGCWRATINIDKHHYQFDCKSFEEACKLREELVEKYYNEFSYKNSQDIFLKNTI